jgi:glucosamine--fructose-6-phosphate aminotransferase (isomerizing)
MDRTNPLVRNSATLSEIMSQPEVWRKTLEDLDSSSVFGRVQKETSGRTTWLFLGCGTSYYLAEAAAASRRLQLGQAAFAVPASEVMFFPDAALLRTPGLQAVIISRSGQTSEALRAAELLRREHKVPTLGITCGSGTPLEATTDLCLVLRSADEKSPVMTRSFTSMLLSLQFLAARCTSDGEFSGSIMRVAARCEAAMKTWAERVEEFVKQRTFSSYAFLGQGPFYGIARESALKLTEMSCSFGQPFHTLEFRHGPKAGVAPQTCLAFFLSERGGHAERKVLADMKELEGTTMTVCNRADAQIRRDSDLFFELNAEVEEVALIAAFVIPAQLLGFFTGIKKGFTPDAPPNLSRVVLLD